MEYLDLYDENKVLTGMQIIRGKGKPVVPANNYIKVVVIFIQNDEGKFLFQVTSKNKGNEIATTGGHVKSGQTSFETVLSEVKEELGIDISNENVFMIDSYIFDIAIIDTYYLKKDIEIKDLVLQKEEVADVLWLTIDEIKNLIGQGKVRKMNIKAFDSVLSYLEKEK